MKDLYIYAPGWGDPSFVIDTLASRVTPLEGSQIVLSYHHRGMGQRVYKTVMDLVEPIVYTAAAYENVWLIGHSMGGLIVNSLAHYIPATKAIVTLGTPHRGTYLAKMGLTGSMKDMATGSDFLRLYQPKKDLPQLNVGGRFEELVIPHSSAFLDHAQHLTVNTNHIGLALSRFVATAIEEFFDDCGRVLT